MGMMCKLFGHKWNACTCSRCGEKRDTEHAYVIQSGRCAEACSVCGATRQVSHDWDASTCRHCGMHRDFVVKDGAVTGYTGNGDTVTMPEDANRIGTKALARNTAIRAVVLHQGMPEIHREVFFRCVNLRSAAIPGVKTIGSSAFSDCVSIADIDLSGVAKVDTYAFNNCIRLQRVDLRNAAEIGENAFRNCTGLTEVVVGESTKIRFDDPGVPIKNGPWVSASFSGCANLREVKLPDGSTHPNNCRLLSLHEFDHCTCTRCGAVDIKRPHRFEKGRCALCGRNEEEYLRHRENLIQTLQSGAKWEDRRDAANELVYYPSSESRDALLAALAGDTQWVVRFCSADTLGEIGDAEAVPGLLKALDDENSTPVAHAAKALGSIGDDRAVEPLIGILRLAESRYRNDYEPVSGAIEALSRFGERVVPRLLQLAMDEPALTRQIVEALEPIGDARSLSLFFDNLKNRDCATSAANGIATIGDASVGDRLAKALGEAEAPEVVEAIAKAMAILGAELSGTGDASTNAKRKFLENLKRIRPGMTEDEADELVGGGVFQMGPNVIHQTPYGEFQLLVTGGIVRGSVRVDALIEKLEAELKEQET